MAVSNQWLHSAVCQFPLVPKGGKRSVSCLSSNVSLAAKNFNRYKVSNFTCYISREPTVAFNAYFTLFFCWTPRFLFFFNSISLSGFIGGRQEYNSIRSCSLYFRTGSFKIGSTGRSQSGSWAVSKNVLQWLRCDFKTVVWFPLCYPNQGINQTDSQIGPDCDSEVHPIL